MAYNRIIQADDLLCCNTPFHESGTLENAGVDPK
jgi:hypothetical protein